VRELENAIERACLLCETTLLRVQDLPPVVQKHAPPDNGAEETELARLATPVGNSQSQPGSANASTNSSPNTAPQKSIPLPQTIVSLKKFARDQELAYIHHVLSLTNQNKEETARLLDISLATLYRKIAGDME
jgi:DNA-binding NtrC family response regulator